MLLFFLTVEAPKIILHPYNKSVATGNDTDFSIAAIGDNLQYHWQKDGNDLSDGRKYHGVHTNVLHIVKVDKDGKGHYRCLVKNDTEEMYSDEALLSASKFFFHLYCFIVHSFSIIVSHCTLKTFLFTIFALLFTIHATLLSTPNTS